MATEETDSKDSFQTITYAATITPDPSAYDMGVCTLTGNVTVANPAQNIVGEELILEFIQDATGGWTTTWGSAYRVNWTPTTTAGLRNVIKLVCDNAGKWLQIGQGIGLAA